DDEIPNEDQHQRNADHGVLEAKPEERADRLAAAAPAAAARIGATAAAPATATRIRATAAGARRREGGQKQDRSERGDAHPTRAPFHATPRSSGSSFTSSAMRGMVFDRIGPSESSAATNAVKSGTARSTDRRIASIAGAMTWGSTDTSATTAALCSKTPTSTRMPFRPLVR